MNAANALAWFDFDPWDALIFNINLLCRLFLPSLVPSEDGHGILPLHSVHSRLIMDEFANCRDSILVIQ